MAMKVGAALVASVVVIGAILATTVGMRSAHSAEKVLGDANCDTTVNSVDASVILQLEAGLLWPNRYSPPFDPAPILPCPFNADVRGGGDITSVDAALILQYSAGLLPQLQRLVTPTPLPAPMRPDTAQLARIEEARIADDGWFLYCPFGEQGVKVFDQLDGVNDHWVPIFCSRGQYGSGSKNLVIYERQGDMLVPLLTLTDTFVYICLDLCYPPDPNPSARDVNGDGMKDLPVSQSTGGNCWECSRLRLFQVRDH